MQDWWWIVCVVEGVKSVGDGIISELMACKDKLPEYMGFCRFLMFFLN